MEKNLIDSTALLDLIKAKRQVIIDNIKYSNEKIEELLKENLSQNYFNVPDLLVSLILFIYLFFNNKFNFRKFNQNKCKFVMIYKI